MYTLTEWETGEYIDELSLTSGNIAADVFWENQDHWFTQTRCLITVMHSGSCWSPPGYAFIVNEQHKFRTHAYSPEAWSTAMADKCLDGFQRLTGKVKVNKIHNPPWQQGFIPITDQEWKAFLLQVLVR